MILHSIQLENWRCFIEPITVGPFSEKLNVLHAPNATGKSTLFEGLRRALLDSHKVKSRELEAIRPWGRILSPCVTVEFTYGEETYRITKRFLTKAEAILERKENGRFVRVFEGEAASEEVQKIFTRHPSGRGVMRFQNWGLAQILWAPQGDLSYAQLTGDVIEDIQSFLNVQVARGSDEGIEKKIEELYLRFFTPSGRLKSGRDAPRLVTLKQQLEDIKKRHQKALEQQEQYEELTRRIEDLHARRLQYKRDAEALSKTLEEARRKAEGYKKLINEKIRQRSKLEALEAKYLEIKQRLERLESIKNELQETRETLSKYEADLPLREKESQTQQQRANAAKEKLSKAKRKREELDKIIKKVESAEAFLETKKRIETLAEKLKEAQALRKKLEVLMEKRSKLNAPDAQVLKDLAKAKRDYTEIRSRLEASLTVLDFIPELEGAIEITKADKIGEYKITPGEKITLEGTPDIELYYKGVARIMVRGPKGPSEEDLEKMREAKQRIEKLLEPFGTDDLDELEERKEASDQIDREIFEAETRLKNTLNELDFSQGFQKEFFQLKQDKKKILEQYPEWEKHPPDITAMKTEVTDFKRQIDAELNEAESGWELAQTAFLTAKNTWSGLAEKTEELKKRKKTLETKYAEFIDTWGSHEDIVKESRKLAHSIETVRSSLEELEEQLLSYGDDPTLILSRLEEQLRMADEMAQKALGEEKNFEGMLAQLSSLGPYTQLATIEEEKAKIEKAIQSEQLQVDAVHLLYNTLVQVKAETLAGIVGPIERIATKTLRRIAGRKLNQVKLGNSFEPSHVCPEKTENPVSLDNVSGGEKEQIYLATRLALAEVIAKDERQLVVLDDVLTFTDSGRFARILSILEEAAEKLQLLILTCHPERYQGLADANFIDLEAIRFPNSIHL